DWPLASIFSTWPLPIARVLASFNWPVTQASELTRLLSSEICSPSILVGCEFTGALRSKLEERTCFREVVLSVDLRTSLTPGPHVQMDLREVLSAKRWREAYLHPPCTHQVLSDTTTLAHKKADGRTFWGIAFFIYCWCVEADHVLVEQPATIIPDFYLHPTQSIRPCDLGDDDRKMFHFFERGRRSLPLLPYTSGDTSGASGHKRLRDFSTADERDRWRSSWLRFPKLCNAVVEAAVGDVDTSNNPCYVDEIEKFAAAWYDAGLNVPVDYATADAQPLEDEQRSYQSCRGRADGRRIQTVIPKLRFQFTASECCDLT
ncbi:MAG: hypothetical protein SGPRY_014446, partial [Prymnesium sp.]